MNPKQYWSINLRYLGILLGVWVLVSFGASVLLVDTLDEVRVYGFKLGFWFAQQGAIYVFVVIIFIYVYLMNRLDRKSETEAT